MLENFDFSLLESKDFKEDSVREFILSKARQHKAKNCHFQPQRPNGFKVQPKAFVILSVSEISKEFKTNFLILWILRYAQYDKTSQYDKQTLVILSEVRQHKAKNPYFKKIKNLWILRFLAKAQYDKIIQYDNVKSFWILRYAQYDKKGSQYDKKEVRQDKSV